jgi:2-haloacid dehalogenase
MSGASVYAFDAYGTLFDVHAAIARHRTAAGPTRSAFRKSGG